MPVIKSAKMYGRVFSMGPFFKSFFADIKILSRADTPLTFVPPAMPKDMLPATRATVIREAKRRHKFLVLREAIQKQLIRDGLGPRVLVLWTLGAPLFFTLSIFAVVSWIGCFAARPEMINWFSPTHWFTSIFGY